MARTATEASFCKESAIAFETGAESKKPQSALLNKVYQARGKVWQEACKRAQNALTDGSVDLNIQVLDLGCGLDPSYPFLSNFNAYCVDLLATLRSSSEFQAPRSSSNLHFLPFDLCSCNELLPLLQALGFRCNIPTIVLMECVSCYLPTESVIRLLKLLSKSLFSAVFISYDPLSGIFGNGFAIESLRKFQQRGAPLLSVVNSPVEVMTRLWTCGWKYSISYTIQQALQLLIEPKRRSLYVQGEVFDEYASLYLLLNLYSLSIATTHQCFYEKIISQRELDVEDHLNVRRTLNDRIAVATNRLLSLELQQKQHNENRSLQQRNPALIHSINIRSIGDQDVNAVVSLYQDSFQEFAKKDKSIAKYVSHSMKELRDFSRSFGRDRFWIALNDKEIIGCVGLKVRSQKSLTADAAKEIHCELVHLCVHRNHRKHGIAQQLVEQVKEYIRRKGEGCLHLTVLDSFVAARSLYCKLGFVEIGIQELSKECKMIHMMLMFR